MRTCPGCRLVSHAVALRIHEDPGHVDARHSEHLARLEARPSMLLILSEDGNNYRHQFEAHIAFPEKPRTGEAVETVASIRVLVEEDDNGKSLAVARQVVREAALHHGYGLQASDQFPADTVVIEKVRDVSVSAWLAMGFFRGSSGR